MEQKNPMQSYQASCTRDQVSTAGDYWSSSYLLQSRSLDSRCLAKGVQMGTT